MFDYQRINLLHCAFRVNRGVVSDKRILLVDDSMTKTRTRA